MSILKLLSYLPLPVLYQLSNAVSFFLFHIVRYRRETSYGNIQRSFPAINSGEILSIQKQAYSYICDSFFELVKAHNISNKELQSRVTIKGIEEIANVLAENNSVLLLSAHTAPTEWIAQALHLNLGCHIDPVYKPAHSKTVDKFIFEVRSRYKSTPIPYKNLAKDVVARKNIKRCIAVLADLAPRRREQALQVKFLNQPTRFFSSIERIAKLSDMPVFFIAINRQKRGHYAARVLKLCDRPSTENNIRLTEKYVQLVESVIVNKPEAWLWTHRRWKHSIT